MRHIFFPLMIIIMRKDYCITSIMESVKVIYQTVQNGRKGKEKKTELSASLFFFFLLTFTIIIPIPEHQFPPFFLNHENAPSTTSGCSWITWRWSRWITWRGSHPFGERVKTVPVKWPIFIIVSRKSTLLTFKKICLCFFLGSAYVRNPLKK